MSKTTGFPTRTGAAFSSRPLGSTVFYVLSRTIFLVGIVASAATGVTWYFAAAFVLAMILAGVEKVAARSATLDAEVEILVAQMRAENSQETAQARPARER